MSSPARPASGSAPVKDRRPLAVIAWLWVAMPFGYGLYELIQKAAKLFSG